MNVLQRSFTAALIMLLGPTAAGADDTAGLRSGSAGTQRGNDLGAYSSIYQRGLFGEDGGPSAGPAAAPAPSSYRLIGTLESGGFAGAVLDDGTGVQTFYRIDQRLPDDSRIVKVRRDRVLIKRPDGTVNELVVTDDAKAPALISLPPDAPSAAPAADASAPGSGQAAGQRPHRRRTPHPDE